MARVGSPKLFCQIEKSCGRRNTIFTIFASVSVFLCISKIIKVITHYCNIHMIPVAETIPKSIQELMLYFILNVNIKIISQHYETRVFSIMHRFVSGQNTNPLELQNRHWHVNMHMTHDSHFNNQIVMPKKKHKHMIGESSHYFKGIKCCRRNV